MFRLPVFMGLVALTPPAAPIVIGGFSNVYGKGGDAKAKAGTGGAGGNSGVEIAQRGTGSTGAAAPPVTAGPVGPVGAGGGATPPAGSVSAGTP